MHLKLLQKLIIPLLIAVPLWGQNALIEVASSVDSSQIYIGDRITYSIVVTHQKGLRVVQPAEGLHLGAFEIKDYHFEEPVEQDGMVIKKYNFSISVYDTGHYAIPPFPVAYFPDTSKNFKIIEAPAVPINVKSILEGEEAPVLKDIKKPIHFPFNYWMAFWITLAVILLAIAGFLAYKAWKKKQEKGYVFKEPEPVRPAHEIALEALHALFSSDLIQNGEQKQFFSRLSEIVRAYLEGRYDIHALEKTTYEIMYAVKNALNTEHKQILGQILNDSDMVKFAKQILELEQVEQLKTMSTRFIEETKIVYVENREVEPKLETTQP